MVVGGFPEVVGGNLWVFSWIFQIHVYSLMFGTLWRVRLADIKVCRDLVCAAELAMLTKWENLLPLAPFSSVSFWRTLKQYLP